MEKKYFTLLLTAVFVMGVQLLQGQDIKLNKKFVGVLGKKNVVSYSPGLFGQTRWLTGPREVAHGYSDTRDLAISHHFSLERAIGPKKSVQLSFGTYRTTIGNASIFAGIEGSYRPADATVAATSFAIREIALAHRWYTQVSLMGSYFEMQVGVQNFTTPDSVGYYNFGMNETRFGRSFTSNLPFLALGFGRRFLLGQNWVVGYQWQIHLSTIIYRTASPTSDYLNLRGEGGFQGDYEFLMKNRVGGLRPLTAQFTLGYLF